jgi:hypothetical protein
MPFVVTIFFLVYDPTEGVFEKCDRTFFNSF